MGRLSRQGRDEREACPPAREGQLIIQLAPKFSSFLAQFSKFGLFAYSLPADRHIFLRLKIKNILIYVGFVRLIGLCVYYNGK